jgi:hypothetical protein
MTPGSEGEDFIDLYIFAATKPEDVEAGSETKASKNPTLFPIPTFSLRKSSKTWKPPWNNSAKSRVIWAKNQLS